MGLCCPRGTPGAPLPHPFFPEHSLGSCEVLLGVTGGRRPAVAGGGALTLSQGGEDVLTKESGVFLSEEGQPCPGLLTLPLAAWSWATLQLLCASACCSPVIPG